MSARRLQTEDTADQDASSLLFTIYLNIVIGGLLVICFELSRHLKQIYLVRMKKRFIRTRRVPAKPPSHFLGWVVPVLNVTEDEVLRMVGMDAYVFLRFIILCFKTSVFFTFWGLIIMLPVYSSGDGGLTGWNKLTLANVVNGLAGQQMWVPAIFGYVFSIYFCYLLYEEYSNFVQKRLEYLVKGDPDTVEQTYYTVMVENIPPTLRSAPKLSAFFDKLFPGEVFSVEIALDLKDLDVLCADRTQVRNRLEKSIAIWNATGERPTVYMSPASLTKLAPDEWQRVLATKTMERCGYSRVDAIETYTILLARMNEEVVHLQNDYIAKLHENEEMGASEVAAIDSRAGVVFDFLNVRTRSGFHIAANRLRDSFGGQDGVYHSANRDTVADSRPSEALQEEDKSLPAELLEKGKRIVEDAAHVAGTGVTGIARGGLQTARAAGKGALRGVMEATKTIEMLTLGAYYRTSSTAFVTFNTRVAKSVAYQMLLSHEHFTMVVTPAPNPKDIVWSNVSIPESQVKTRTTFANVACALGAIFWSAVVAFVSASSNLDSISQQLTWLQQFQDTVIYQLANMYLAVIILLILLACLPLIFDLISRNYEGLKLESEIQNTIMARYFYYQLANIYVTVTAGSVFTSMNEIINNPGRIVNILGESLPQVSIYFANLMTVKVLTSIPLEMLRIWPFITIVTVKTCTDKKKCTRRELKTGAFTEPPVDYGWLYPNLMMILMILLTYSCIAPLLMPFGIAFFAGAYIMYKYQLLYVLINHYQAGGDMWYAIFNRCMVALLCAVATLIGYLGLRKTFYSGPFYLLLPLPFLLLYFWRQCDEKFRPPSTVSSLLYVKLLHKQKLSLECAVDIDSINQALKHAHETSPLDAFDAKLYRQPSLAEGPLEPEPYRVDKKEEEVHSPLSDIEASVSVDTGGRLSFMEERALDADDENDMDASVSQLLAEEHSQSRRTNFDLERSSSSTKKSTIRQDDDVVGSPPLVDAGREFSVLEKDGGLAERSV